MSARRKRGQPKGQASRHGKAAGQNAGNVAPGPQPGRAEPLNDRAGVLAGAALFGAVLLIYFATASPFLAGGDNAEFVTIFAKGGVAHPSGYPLYCILLRLCAWMPGGPPLGSARVTAVVAAFSVWLLYRACQAWTASWSASILAASFYAFSSLAWRLATEAEVFALNALFASLVLWAAAPNATVSPARRVVLLAGVAGLALSNHLTIVFLAPVGLLAAAEALVATGARTRVAAAALASFAAGLCPYFYCYAVARAPNGRYIWGDPSTWRGLLRHVTRADYGPLRLTASEQSSDWLSNIGLFFTQTANHALAAPLAIGLFGLWCAYLRIRDSERRGTPLRLRRRHVLALFAAWVLAGPLFAAFLDVPGGGTLVDRFHLLPEVILSIGVAWGLDGWRGLRDGRKLPVAFVALMIMAIGVLHSWPSVRAGHSDALEVYTKNTETSAPPQAVILGTGDYRLFSFAYAASAGWRPDVTYVDPHLLAYDWYRRSASRDLGAPIPPSPEPSTETIRVVERAFALGRPVVLTDGFDRGVLTAFRSYPLGTLIRLLPPGVTPPPPESVEHENIEMFAKFQRWSPLVRDDEWATAVLPTYQRPWVALARMFDRRGDDGRARVNRERSKEWGPSVDAEQ